MNDKEVTIILCVLFVIQYSLDVFQNECISRLKGKKLLGLSNLAIHHIISIFANFGWLYNNKKILISNLILILSILLGWMTNDNKCFISDEFNKLCGYEHYELFHDLFYYFDIKILHPPYYIFLLFILLYKINKN
jgi:hypothetical protein